MPPEFRSRVSSRIARFKSQLEAFTRQKLQQAGARYQRDMHGKMSGPTSANSISVRSGAARRSVRFQTLRIPNGLRLEMAAGGNAFYVITHEDGKTITPRQAKNLAIPLAAAKTKAGVARGRSPRSIAGLKLIITRRGSKLLVKPIGAKKAKRFVPMFVLVPSVRIPARLGFRKTVASVVRQVHGELKAGFRNFAKSRAR